MKPRSKEHGGSSFLEFVLVGIPMIFVLFSTVELARGMWTYHTLAYSIKEGTRYAIVHGSDCATTPNSCTVTLGQIATLIHNAGVGLDTSKLTLTFTPNTGAATTCTLATCMTNSTTWPPSTANSPGMILSISARYQFRSAIAMFWPGTKAGSAVPALYFPAASTDTIQF